MVAPLRGRLGDPQLGDGPGMQAGFEQLRAREPVPRVGVDRGESGLADRPVVRVRECGMRPVDLGRVGDHPLRDFADDRADLLPQPRIGSDASVGMAVEADVVAPDDLGRGALLGLPKLGAFPAAILSRRPASPEVHTQ